MKHLITLSVLFFLSVDVLPQQVTSPGSPGGIPLAEHPRPDWERPEWENLNGTWSFAFDTENIGLQAGWQDQQEPFNRQITVPFPWGSELSGVGDDADIGWYRRSVSVDPSWEGKRVFLVIGASDWETTVWLDGQRIGSHKGGYVPIEMELTPWVRFGESQQLVIRADDVRRDFTLYGKQGYGNARGIWQTVYLEARGPEYLKAMHLAPDIDRSEVVATAYLDKPATADRDVLLYIQTDTRPIEASLRIRAGENNAAMRIPIPGVRLWSLEDPHLYNVTAQLGSDSVRTYFGMRKISVENLPGTNYPYIALNNEPVYLQLALDQSYHPEGYYTFPSDAFMRQEIQRSKSIGLNGIRTHIKVEIPRKLYWADKLGLLVMADLPNSWGAPDREMRAESEATLRGMIERDFNHPAIFSWIVFNETWGLTRDGKYEKDTQEWVVDMYELTKTLDTTRLAEDNSICCGFGHTRTDINSWHQYLPGYKWEDHLKEVTENTYAGSTYNFEEGFIQGQQPLINSECGNVWGYDGSSGDVDWSWDYHMMMNTFRKYPKVAGWLYTEHHDVINEWNGYWRFDRSEKETGMGELVPGMTLSDLHAGIYLSTGMEICREVAAGSQIEIPLFLSDMAGRSLGGDLQIAYNLSVTDGLGENFNAVKGAVAVEHLPWMQKVLEPLRVQVPETDGVGLLSLEVRNVYGQVLSRNFMFLLIGRNGRGGPGNRNIVLAGAQGRPVPVVSQAPDAYSNSEWSQKSWKVLDGKKVNGAGNGYFEYTFSIPPGMAGASEGGYFMAELSAKELFVKDRENYESEQDFMKGSRVANSSNPNSYPMTDWKTFPSRIRILVNGQSVQAMTLPDDPADHRGVLSWHAQPRDGKLREAGSYGYLVKAPIPLSVLREALAGNRQIRIRLQAEGDGGIAVYGKDFGRYPMDPMLVFDE